jgi:uncharacterized membrane protein
MELVEFGPISFIAIAFPDIGKLKGELGREIRRLSQEGIIRVIGLLAVAKDQNGEYAGIQVTELPDEDRMKLGAGVGALIGYGAGGMPGAEAGAQAGAEMVAQKVADKEFGMSREQVRSIAEAVPPGMAVGFLLVEHLWAKRFKEIALNQDGILLANGFISPQALVGLGAQLAEGARVAEQLQTA